MRHHLKTDMYKIWHSRFLGDCSDDIKQAFSTIFTGGPNSTIVVNKETII